METLVKSNGKIYPQLSTLFDDYISREIFNWPGRNSNGNTLPAVNIRETGDAYELEVASPGMKKEDFKVELNNNTLTISAQLDEKYEDDNSAGSYNRREFNYQSFSRSFTLPEKMVEGDNITARYSDGILYLTVPKTEQAKAKPVKMIEIS